MLTREQAERLAQDYLVRLAATGSEQLDLVITQSIERPNSWVFFYDSARHQQTLRISDALAGNGPIVVSKLDGALIQAGTAVPVEESIVVAESHF
jgi:hypothetical protein